MKKSFLLLIAMASILPVQAQQVRQGNGIAELTTKKPLAQVNKHAAANKTTTLLCQDWFYYNIAIDSGGVGTTSALISTYPDSNIFLTSATSAPLYIWAHGMGVSFDPVSPYFSTGWASPSVLPPSFVVFSGANSFIDSIEIVGVYQRKNTIYPNDTLYIDVTYTSDTGAMNGTYASSNLVTQGIIPAPVSPWDTTWTIANAYYNWNTNSIDSVNTRPVWRFTKILDATAAADTTVAGLNEWTFPATGSPVTGTRPWPMSVPAGEKVVVYAHFASGHNYPLGTADTACNMWKHYSQDFGLSVLSAYASIHPWDQNCGLVTSTDDKYHTVVGIAKKYSYWNMSSTVTVPVLSPTYFYTNPAQLHHPWFGFYVRTPPPCWLSSRSITSSSMNIVAKPNPATNQLTISHENSGTTGTATLTNMLGQVVATQKAREHETVFNTSTLPAGIYIYTLLINGERFTGRVTVIH